MTLDPRRRDLIVVGGSAGALGALGDLLSVVQPDLPAAIVATVHMSPQYDSQLVRLLRGRTRLPVSAATAGLPVKAGHVYVSVPDHHLFLTDAVLQLNRGPKEHFTRPAVDVLFRSAAMVYGPRAVGILLSGGGYDGTLGMLAIKAAGGVALVQDPESTPYATMLRSAINRVSVDAVVSVRDIAATLSRLASGEDPPLRRQRSAR